jgi:hypothetical protein
MRKSIRELQAYFRKSFGAILIDAKPLNGNLVTDR